MCDKMKNAWALMATGTKSLNEMAKIMNDWGLREICKQREHNLSKQSIESSATNFIWEFWFQKDMSKR
jgi:hypothetical protein